MHLIYTNQRPDYMADTQYRMLVAAWPPVCQSLPVPEASAENNVR